MSKSLRVEVSSRPSVKNITTKCADQRVVYTPEGEAIPLEEIDGQRQAVLGTLNQSHLQQLPVQINQQLSQQDLPAQIGPQLSQQHLLAQIDPQSSQQPQQQTPGTVDSSPLPSPVSITAPASPPAQHHTTLPPHACPPTSSRPAIVPESQAAIAGAEDIFNREIRARENNTHARTEMICGRTICHCKFILLGPCCDR